MIFVTVGGQLPFDRMVDVVDAWAAQPGRPPVFAQVGATQRPPNHVEWARSLPPEAFRRKVAEADVLVAHAGMGTILTALEAGTPLVVMPRRADRGEHRNDHQVATARALREIAGISVADDEGELRDLLDRLDSVGRPSHEPRAEARAGLLDALRAFVDAGS